MHLPKPPENLQSNSVPCSHDAFKSYVPESWTTNHMHLHLAA